MEGYKLSTGEQEGNFTLLDKDINYSILYNDLIGKYFISLYEDGVLLIGGVFLTNGTDILSGFSHLGIGSSLQYRGKNDLSEWYLIYKE